MRHTRATSWLGRDGLLRNGPLIVRMDPAWGRQRAVAAGWLIGWLTDSALLCCSRFLFCSGTAGAWLEWHRVQRRVRLLGSRHRHHQRRQLSRDDGCVLILMGVDCVVGLLPACLPARLLDPVQAVSGRARCCPQLLPLHLLNLPACLPDATCRLLGSHSQGAEHHCHQDPRQPQAATGKLRRPLGGAPQ